MVEVLALSTDHVRVALSREELRVLASGLRESLELLEDWEFETRMGCTRVVTEGLLDSLGSLIRSSRTGG